MAACRADIWTAAALVGRLPVSLLAIRIVVLPKRGTAATIITNCFKVGL